MFNRMTPLTVFLISLLLMTGSPSSQAEEPPQQTEISFTNSAGDHSEHAVLRTPSHTLPDGPPETWSTGISVLETESGLTVLVESVAVTGDPPLPDDNDFTRIDDAVQAVAAVGDGTVVRLVGDVRLDRGARLGIVGGGRLRADPGTAGRGRRHPASPALPPRGGRDRRRRRARGPRHLLGGLPRDVGRLYQGLDGGEPGIRGFDWTMGMFYDGRGAPGLQRRHDPQQPVSRCTPDTPGNYSAGIGAGVSEHRPSTSASGEPDDRGQRDRHPGDAAGDDQPTRARGSCVALQSNTLGWQMATTVCGIVGQLRSGSPGRRTAVPETFTVYGRTPRDHT